MAFKCGFYNAIDNDRTYSANEFGDMFDGLIKDGVYATIGDALMVVPGTGLGVMVKSGRAWFNKTWSVNTTDLPLDLGLADFLLPRIDAVVLEVDTRVSVRDNSIKVVKGYPAVDPTPPAMTSIDGVYQYPLAYIDVAANAEAVTKNDIHIQVGKDPCPFVTGILDSVDISPIYQDWEGQFETWFEGIKSSLEGDVVGNLLYQIGNKVDKSDKATEEDALLGTDDTKWMTPKMVGLLTDPVKSAKVGDIVLSMSKIEDSRYHLCDGTTLDKTEYAELFNKIGYSFGHPNLFMNPESYSPIIENETTNKYAALLRESYIDGHRYSLVLSEIGKINTIGFSAYIKAIYYNSSSNGFAASTISDIPGNSASVGSPMLFSLGTGKIYIIYSIGTNCYIDYWTRSGNTVGSTRTNLRTIANTYIAHICGYKLDASAKTAYFVCVEGDNAATATRLTCITINESSYQKTVIKNNVTVDDVGFILGYTYYSKNQKLDVRSPSATFVVSELDVISFLNTIGTSLDVVMSTDSTQVASADYKTARTLWINENGALKYKEYSLIGFPHTIYSTLNNVLSSKDIRCFILDNHQIGVVAARVEGQNGDNITGFSWTAGYNSGSSTYYPNAFMGFARTRILYPKKICLFGASREATDVIYLYRIIDFAEKPNHGTSSMLRITSIKANSSGTAFKNSAKGDLENKLSGGTIGLATSNSNNTVGIRSISATPVGLIPMYIQFGVQGYAYGWDFEEITGEQLASDTNQAHQYGTSLADTRSSSGSYDWNNFDETKFRLPYQPEISTYAYIKIKP